jgi:hypothetical protein
MSADFNIAKTGFLRLLLALALWSMPLLAQYNTASLGGTVLDTSGGSVPRATVTVENKNTGLAKTTTTGTDGAFLFPSLPVGNYRLTVELAGFTTYVQEGITLEVGQAASQTVTLKVGKASEQVTVSANAELVPTREATLGQVIDQKQVIDLPLNGRGAQALVFLAAGTVNVTERYCGLNCEGGVYPGQQQAAVSGGGPGQVNYQLDGASHNDSYLNANLPFPNPDAIQEFSLEANNLSAVYGDAAGVVNIVSKSGTNQIHGDLFEFLRNGALNARYFFAPDQDTLKRNQYGGSIGGPIKKDRVFYFGTYQGTRVRSAAGGLIAFVPTAPERQGDFSALCTRGFNANGICSDSDPTHQLLNPVTGAPFAHNQIPVASFSPVAQFFLKYLPLPNGPNGQLTYIGPQAVQNDDQFTTKIDYNRGRNQLSGRYFFTYFRQPPVISKTNILQNGAAGNHVRVQTVSINDNFAASPALLFNTWFGWRAQTGGSLSSAPFSFPDAGVSIAAPSPPELRLNVGGAFNINTNHNGDFDRTGWTLRENVTLAKGAHQLHVGGEAVHIKVNVRNTYRQSGFYNFTNALSNNNLVDFMLGHGGGSPGFGQGGGEFLLLTGIKWSAFAQDDWRINPRLTLNLGWRWDPYFPFTEERGRIVCFRPGVQSTRFTNAPLGMLFGGAHHDPLCPENGSYANAGNFGPRLGFAYRVTADGRTSLRGGVGMYYSPPATAGYTNFADNAPFSAQFQFQNVDLADPYGAAGVTSPFPAAYAPNNPASNAPFFLPTTIVLAFQPDYRLPSLATWNLTLERQVGESWLVRAAYVGNKGTHLYSGDLKGYFQANPGMYIPGSNQDNRPFKDFNSIAVLGSYNNSNYHALQLSSEKRLSHGLSLLAAYTWSKGLDDFAPLGAYYAGFGYTNPFHRHFDYGVSDDDARHNFKFSNVWQVPAPRASGLAGKLLEGWEVNSIWFWHSGFPFSVFTFLDNSFSGQGLDRADFVKAGNPQLSSGRSHGAQVAQYFDTSFFGPNALGTFGNSGKNILHAPRFFNVDLGLLKQTKVTENFSVQFRAEFFNAFNNVNLGSTPNGSGNPLGIDNVQVDPTFGQILAAGDPRVIQFALKFLF